MTTCVILGFAYSTYKLGQVEAQLGDKYLWMLQLQHVSFLEIEDVCVPLDIS